MSNAIDLMSQNSFPSDDNIQGSNNPNNPYADLNKPVNAQPPQNPPHVPLQNNANLNAPISDQTIQIEALWIFKGSIIMAAISVIALILGYWIPEFVILIPTLPIYNGLVRKNFHFQLDSEYFVLHQGILSKQVRNVPYGVIQNIFVKQDLFDRVFGLASLVVENASDGGGKGFFSKSTNRQQSGGTLGFRGNKISMAGLSKEKAEYLKGVLMEKMVQNPNMDKVSGL